MNRSDETNPVVLGVREGIFDKAALAVVQVEVPHLGLVVRDCQVFPEHPGARLVLVVQEVRGDQPRQYQ